MLSINDERNRNARASFGSSAVRRNWSWFFFAHGGVLFRQQPLVADGLAWRVLHGDVAALALVAVEHVVVGFARAGSPTSLSARLNASWIPLFMPMAPIGLFTCAELPARIARPPRNLFATRWCTV